jgi:hypothetical protein
VKGGNGVRVEKKKNWKEISLCLLKSTWQSFGMSSISPPSFSLVELSIGDAVRLWGRSIEKADG